MRGHVRCDPGIFSTLTRRIRCGEGGATVRTKAAAAGSKPGSAGALLTWPHTDGESALLLPSVSPPTGDGQQRAWVYPQPHGFDIRKRNSGVI